MAVKKAPAKKATPVKKTVAAKKAVLVKKAPIAKKTVIKKPVAKKTANGGKYVCQVCGFGLTVDETSGFAGVYDIICCKKSMKVRR
jgi:hypothetical protein